MAGDKSYHEALFEIMKERTQKKLDNIESIEDMTARVALLKSDLAELSSQVSAKVAFVSHSITIAFMT